MNFLHLPRYFERHLILPSVLHCPYSVLTLRLAKDENLSHRYLSNTGKHFCAGVASSSNGLNWQRGLGSIEGAQGEAKARDVGRVILRTAPTLSSSDIRAFNCFQGN